MGPFWVSAYIGCPWSEETDCFFWFREIQRKVFSIEVSDCLSMASKRQEHALWVDVVIPDLGDAVWMTQNGSPHHIGVWTGSGVLHACQGQGVIHDSLSQLALQGWEVKRYDRHITRFPG